MLAKNWWQKITKTCSISLVAIALTVILTSCGSTKATTLLAPSNSKTAQAGDIAEVSPPEAIQTLRQSLEIYQPQVNILSPQADEVFQDDKVNVQLQVRDLPIFKNPELKLGPHLHVIVDNQPYIAVYDVNEPLTIPDLAPGTHTLRVFASRPWHESFKNAGAYAQTTFHIFTKTQDNNPDPAQPLLTYSRPKGSYGAEPILLDFYLTNAPLRLAAKDNVADWRIRCTINGNSFVLDRWQPVYLQGFKPGKNWVQLEFIDEKGNAVKNVFNNTVRIITYEPKGKDTLSKLVRGELSADAARGIVNQNYTAKTPTPEPSPIETPSPTPSSSTTPEPSPIPTETPTAPEEATQQPQKSGGYFNRFRRQNNQPSPLPDITPPIVTPSPIPVEPTPPEAPLEEDTAAKEEVETVQPTQKPGGYFNRFRRPVPQPSPEPPTLPEIIDTPTVAPSPIPEEPENLDELIEEKAVKEKIETTQPSQKLGGYFNRFRRPTPKPSPELSPTLPEVTEQPVESEPQSDLEPKLDIKEILLP
ncbi:hypothetical protein [Aliterella atlantica]|uniref:hypothetical protein n=1 Tax=Aliterella atlantica TaxID=1827278 RepID=UPI00090807BE|nr:hypothetical protein [Aliterella atlantica]